MGAKRARLLSKLNAGVLTLKDELENLNDEVLRCSGELPKVNIEARNLNVELDEPHRWASEALR